MKTKKRRYENYWFYDYCGIAAHLEEMAEKGWLISRVTPFWWEYRKIEPRRLRFSVTYFSEASDFNPYPTENQQTFLEYCGEAGWRLAAEWAQMQMFYSEREEPIPIETDEGVKLRAIHRAMKKNFLPSSILLAGLAVLQLFMQAFNFRNGPARWLADGTALTAGLLWLLVLVISAFSLLGYACWYGRSKRAVEAGGSCAIPGQRYRALARASTVIVLISLALWFCSVLKTHTWWITAAVIGYMVLLLALVFGTKNIMKKMRAPGSVNRTVTAAVCIVLSIALTAALTVGILRGRRAGLFSSRQPEIYTTAAPDGTMWEWEIYHDPLPLRVEDVTVVDYEHYSCQWDARETFLAGYYEGRQDAPPDGSDVPELSYTISDVKFAPLYGVCLEDALKVYDYEDDVPEEERAYWEKTDGAGWEADAVYRLYRGGQPWLNRYVICWEDRIVSVTFSWEITREQAAAAAAGLRR